MGDHEREAAQELHSTAILTVSAIRVDAQCIGWGALRSRQVQVQQYSAAEAQPSLQMGRAFRPPPQNAMSGLAVTTSN